MQTSLSNRYKLGDRLAAGAMGTVFAADDTRLGRPVAVKLLKEHLSDDATFIERFRREARAAAALAHPNIAQVYDFGVDGSHHYLVMELVEGRDLARVLREDGPLSPDRAVHIADRIASALAHAHEAGVVHRDIKPANVIVGNDDRVKVTDFGIARAAGDSTLTATGSVMGTAQYLSPEQASGKPTEPASDIYSLGIVLFEMLTGSVPFTGESALNIAMRHVNEDVPAPSSVADDVPAWLDDVVAKACAKDPSSRFSSATALNAALAGGASVATTDEPGAADTAKLEPPAATTQELTPNRVWPIPGDRYDPMRIGRAVIGTFVILAVVAVGLLLWRLAQDEPEPVRRKDRAEQPAEGSRASGTPEGTVVEITEEVIGAPYEPVVAALEEEGFEVVVEEQASDEFEEGLVVGTDPPPGTEGIEQDTTITLFVSTGSDDEDDDVHPGDKSKGKAKGHSKDEDD